MKRTSLFAGAFAAGLGLAGLAQAADITIEDAYARSSTAMSKSGAAFMTIVNAGAGDDRLIGAASDIAARVELHTHIQDENGVMLMREDEDGFPIPAGGSHALARGGDHVMFMGLTAPLEHGDTVALTLTFEKAGEITLTVPVDLERKPAHGGQMRQGMGHN